MTFDAPAAAEPTTETITPPKAPTQNQDSDLILEAGRLGPELDDAAPVSLNGTITSSYKAPGRIEPRRFIITSAIPYPSVYVTHFRFISIPFSASQSWYPYVNSGYTERFDSDT
jgi:hypothetical protein